MAHTCISPCISYRLACPTLVNMLCLFRTLLYKPEGMRRRKKKNKKNNKKKEEVGTLQQSLLESLDSSHILRQRQVESSDKEPLVTF